jgi:hypothetical protein
LANPDAAARIERIEARGLPVPDHLIPPPVLPGYDEWIGAFWYLSRDRHPGGPLPAASIDRHVAGWDGEEAAFFRRVMFALDDVWYRHQNPDAAADADPMAARDKVRSALKGSVR